jgi:hypothetical protein
MNDMLNDMPEVPEPTSAALGAATAYLITRLGRPPFPPHIEAMARTIDWYYNRYIKDGVHYKE